MGGCRFTPLMPALSDSPMPQISFALGAFSCSGWGSVAVSVFVQQMTRIKEDNGIGPGVHGFLLRLGPWCQKYAAMISNTISRNVAGEIS